MIIEAYEKADCTRFRTPPIDISKLDSLLERAMLDAWQNGSSADSVLASLTNNRKVIGTLTAQIEESVRFRRDTEIKRTDAVLQKKVKDYKEERDKIAGEISLKYDAEIAAGKRRALEMEEQTRRKRQGYDATKASLEDLRERVKCQLGELGGENGLKALLEIQQMVTKPDEEPAQRIEGANLKRKTQVEKAAVAGSSLSQADLTQPDSDETYKPEKKKGRIYRAAQKFWGVLNYKIW